MVSTEKWYISCTAIWNDADKKDEFKKLESDLEEENKGLIKSEDYKKLKEINDTTIREWLVPEKIRHSTVLNLLEVEINKEDSNEAEKELVEILNVLKNNNEFEKSLDVLFKPIEVILYEIWFNTDGIKFQFKEVDTSSNLVNFRGKAKSLIQNKVEVIVKELSKSKYCKEFSWNLYSDKSKNCGRGLFGSFTRRNVSSKTNLVYDLKLIQKEIKITFNKMYLLVSDRLLMNEAARDNEKRIIIGKE